MTLAFRTAVATTSAAMALLASPTATQAVELAGLAPYADHAFGQQTDANTPPAYEQLFVAPAGATLETITWWGYHGTDSIGPGQDDFVVTLGGNSVAGSLAVDNSNVQFSKYTLTVTPMVLASASVAIVNNGVDVAWFWQSAASTGSGPHATDVAFQLDGALAAVPEPSAPALLLLGLAAMAAARFRRAR